MKEFDDMSEAFDYCRRTGVVAFRPVCKPHQVCTCLDTEPADRFDLPELPVQLTLPFRIHPWGVDPVSVAPENQVCHRPAREIGRADPVAEEDLAGADAVLAEHTGAGQP